MNVKKTKSKNPQLPIDKKQLALLEKLSNACAVSGEENEVRAIILNEIKSLPVEHHIDAMGNLLVSRKSTSENPLRVMLAAHMDEVGFMLSKDEEKGIFRFESVGGIDPRQLVGKTVLVGKEHHPGIIGAAPIHLVKHEELNRKIPVDNLRIDLGPSGSTLANIGDRATFATTYEQVGPSLFGKAFDDRLGVATLIEMLRHPYPDLDLLAAFTVQEEVGLRGARVAGYAFNPDIAIIIDSTPANDMPSWDNEENIHYNTRLGAGPAIYVADRATISDPRLVRFIKETATAESIPHQIRQPGGGGTDAGAIHTQRSGIPSISISVPARGAHTAVMIVRLEDWQHTVSLLYAALTRITPKVLER
jgi:tetrahedral aminopeptidase